MQIRHLLQVRILTTFLRTSSGNIRHFRSNSNILIQTPSICSIRDGYKQNFVKNSKQFGLFYVDVRTVSSNFALLTKDSGNFSPSVAPKGAEDLKKETDTKMEKKSADVTVTDIETKPDQAYKPVQHHWFFRKDFEDKAIWRPFTFLDSNSLEEASNSTSTSTETIVATEGGRYDVTLSKRERIPVYWREDPSPVRRCSWFYKGTSDARYVPYAEDIADTLEEEFRLGVITSTWNRKVSLPDGESVVLHSSSVMVHFFKQSSPDSWSNAPAAARARTVRRGPDNSEIDEGDVNASDHLLLLIHGIGSVCDLKFRSVEEVVDDFRSISSQLVQSHYKSSCEQGVVNRVEVLPVSWHWNLHSEETGIDRRIGQITLESVPKLRGFTNDTLLDILFYTSPKFCQTIMETVGSEINRIYTLFKQRNPSFDGGVSLGGHSLGSLILFDLLCHQNPNNGQWKDEQKGDTAVNNQRSKPQLQKQLSYVMGAAGTGQPSINYPQLIFQPKAFFALGSPIGMFVCVRGLDALGEDFKLPTCPAFFNIFHPFDPVAYRIESLINPELSVLQPVQVPHHKGRKRMHLELKDTVARVGADLKHRIIDSVRSTWDSFYQMATFSSPREAALQERVKEVIEEELIREAEAERAAEESVQPSSPGADHQESEIEKRLRSKFGKLNSGRRVDHVLQEAPFELFNEYIFALASHVCYWESEDTMLLILKEIYAGMGIEADRQLPPPGMTIERTISTASSSGTPGEKSGSVFTFGEGTTLSQQTLPEEAENQVGASSTSSEVSSKGVPQDVDPKKT